MISFLSRLEQMNIRYTLLMMKGSEWSEAGKQTAVISSLMPIAM